jgi:hypothetical protein
LQWNIIISQDHFSVSGPKCRLSFEVYALHSQALIGKDAYMIAYNIINNNYDIEKVADEPAN